MIMHELSKSKIQVDLSVLKSDFCWTSVYLDECRSSGIFHAVTTFWEVRPMVVCGLTFIITSHLD